MIPSREIKTKPKTTTAMETETKRRQRCKSLKTEMNRNERNQQREQVTPTNPSKVTTIKPIPAKILRRVTLMLEFALDYQLASVLFMCQKELQGLRSFADKPNQGKYSKIYVRQTQEYQQSESY